LCMDYVISYSTKHDFMKILHQNHHCPIFFLNNYSLQKKSWYFCF